MRTGWPEPPGFARFGTTLLDSRLALWAGYVAVHLVLAFQGLRHGASPLSDVTQVYQPWAHDVVTGRGIVGIDRPFVYPVVALAPILLPIVAGAHHYTLAWIVMAAAADAVAVAVLTSSGQRRDMVAAWWWLLFLLLLGPVAIGRIDTVAAALAVAAITVIATRPATAHAVLTVAVWIKVWPVAVITAAVAVYPRKLRALAATLTVSAVIVGVDAALGGLPHILAFVGDQGTRNLQYEAPVSTFWMWAAMSKDSTTHVFLNTALRTMEVSGPGATTAGAIVTIAMPLSFVAIAILGLQAARRHPAPQTFPVLAMALISTLLVFDKVGSPQYVTWLAAPVIAGLRQRSPGHRLTAATTLAIAAATIAIYPYFTAELRQDQPAIVAVLTVRNALMLACLAIALTNLIRQAFPRPAVRRQEEPGWATVRRDESPEEPAR